MKKVLNLTKFDTFVFWGVVIDNLFCPYFWLKCIPYSYPLVLIWFLKRGKNLQEGNSQIKTLSIFFVLSTFMGILFFPGNDMDNCVRLITLLIGLLSLRLFEHCISKIPKVYDRLFSLLFYFVVFVFIWAALFYVDNSLYEQLRYIFNMRIPESTEDIYALGIRFGYYWSDENNIGYMSVAVMLFLLTRKEVPIFRKMLLILMTFVIVIATMSTGATFSYVVGLGCFALFGSRSFFREIKKHPIYLCLIILFVSGCIYFSYILLTSDVYMQAIIRLTEKTDGGDNRMEKYIYFLQTIEYYKYLLWGYGGISIVGGKAFATHNGFFYIFSGFGFIALCSFLRVFKLLKLKSNFDKWIWIVPVLVGFTINIMITEDKIVGIIVLLYAYVFNEIKGKIKK